MARSLTCGHPVECVELDDEGQEFCAWCQQVEGLTRYAETLKAQLTKTAIILKGGWFWRRKYDLTVHEPIGLFLMQGGEVRFADHNWPETLKVTTTANANSSQDTPAEA